MIKLFKLKKEDDLEIEYTGAKELVIRYDGQHLIYSKQAWKPTTAFAYMAAAQACEKFVLPEAYTSMLHSVEMFFNILDHQTVEEESVTVN